jgi:predicted DNA-binding transcriptional regulator AlpA
MSERRLRRMVRGWKGVHDYIPYGPTQLQQMVKEGRLKPPIKIGPRAIAWFEDDLIEAQQQFEREATDARR